MEPPQPFGGVTVVTHITCHVTARAPASRQLGQPPRPSHPLAIDYPHPTFPVLCCVRGGSGPDSPAMADFVDPRMTSIKPRIRYNTIGGINGPLVFLDNVRSALS